MKNRKNRQNISGAFGYMVPHPEYHDVTPHRVVKHARPQLSTIADAMRKMIARAENNRE